MRSILLAGIPLLTTLFVFTHPAAVYSQACQASNLRIKVNSISSTSSSCQVNATLSWIQKANNGNKFTNVHIWTSNNYPNPALSYSAPPTATQLTNSLGTLVIDNPGSSTPGFYGSYPPAPGVKLINKTASTVVSKVSNFPVTGMDSFTVSNVIVTLSNSVSCASHFILVADVWSSQGNQDQVTQCSSLDGTFSTPDVSISGQILCNKPPQLKFTLSTTSSSPVTFNYQIYADEAQTGNFVQSDPLISSGSGTVSSGAPFQSSAINNPSYPKDNLIAIIQVTGNPVSTFGLITNNCVFVLPVKLVYFKGAATDAGTQLSWETAMEQNNKGFEVQRKVGGGDFETITFVPSKTSDGNSNEALTYGYLDSGSFPDNVMYRLAQVDLDEHMNYSELVVVREEQKGAGSVIVYPNPSPDGVITLSFGNSNAKDIVVCDVSGKALKTVQGVQANQYSLQLTQPGVYFLRVKERNSGQTSVVKLLVGRY